MVYGLVHALIDGSQLMLGRGCLVVLGLGRHSQLPQFLIYIVHIGADPLSDDAEIVVVHLLPLWRHSAE